MHHPKLEAKIYDRQEERCGQWEKPQFMYCYALSHTHTHLHLTTMVQLAITNLLTNFMMLKIEEANPFPLNSPHPNHQDVGNEQKHRLKLMERILATL